MPNTNKTRVELKSKLGQTFYRFGQPLSPDSWTAFDLTDAQIESLKDSVVLSVREGGALDMRPNPWEGEKYTLQSLREERAEEARYVRENRPAPDGSTPAGRRRAERARKEAVRQEFRKERARPGKKPTARVGETPPAVDEARAPVGDSAGGDAFEGTAGRTAAEAGERVGAPTGKGKR